MKAEWNNCFFCLKDISNYEKFTKRKNTKRKAFSKKPIGLLLNYILNPKYPHIVTEVHSLIGSHNVDAKQLDGVKLCDKCENQVENVNNLHQQLEVIQMKLVNVLKSVRKTIRDSFEEKAGENLVLFEEWLREQDDTKHSEDNLKDQHDWNLKQRKILETLKAFQAAVIQTDQDSIEIPRVFLNKYTNFRTTVEPDQTRNFSAESQQIIKTEAVEDLDHFDDDTLSASNAPINEIVSDNFTDLELPPRKKRRTKGRSNKAISKKQLEANEISSRPKRSRTITSKPRRLISKPSQNKNKESVRKTYQKKRKPILPAFSLKPHSKPLKKFNPKNQYACDTCPYVTVSPYQFDHHLQTHEIPIPEDCTLPLFQCQICPYNPSFSQNQLYLWHMACHEGHVTIPCDLCKERLTPFQLHDHMKTHIDKVFPCPNCFYIGSTREAYLKHLKLHFTDTSIMKCDICDKTFRLRKKLLAHYNEDHQVVDKLICGVDNCQEEFLDTVNLQVHRNSHVKSFSCPKCDKNFTYECYLKTHLLTHSEGKPFSCDLCGTSFSQKVTLQRHVKNRHMAEKFKCELCDKEYADKESVKMHMVIHTGEGFKCEVGNCGKLFGSERLLKRHMTSHSDEKGFVCEECGAGFKTVVALNMHRKMHGGEKNFKCHYCEKAFLFRKYLVQHLRIHTGEKPYVCEACGKDFNQYAALYLHKRKCRMIGEALDFQEK